MDIYDFARDVIDYLEEVGSWTHSSTGKIWEWEQDRILYEKAINILGRMEVYPAEEIAGCLEHEDI
jgi:hypothetical protein